MVKEKIAIIGAGGFGREVFSLLNKDLFDIVGFIDNHADHEIALPAPIIGDDDILPLLKSLGLAVGVCITIGNMARRKKIFDKAIAAGLSLPKIIHSSTSILTSVPLGDGVIIYPGVIVMSDCYIGKGVLLNSGVTIGHDVVIGDFSNINPGVHLAGKITIGEHTMIGIGACVRENIRIGNRVVVGAGSVVVNDIPDDCVVYGVPAKIQKVK
ncbi:MAG: pilus assembly protein [Chitinophagaceae bacterium]|nr:MAG: pilus assembly protein [Chitinophagaceae bacterium]